jgi:branched-chain amino acid transport system permease protein
MSRFSPARAAALAAIVALYAMLPVLIPDLYTNVVSTAAVYGMMALSMNLIVGYTGQASLGHAAFLGVGAFGSGYALTKLDYSFLPSVAVAMLLGIVAALVLGGVALRLSGLYLALVTIAFGLFAQETLFNIRALTGGGSGQEAPRPGWFDTDVQYAYLCLSVLLIMLVLDWRLTSSRPGRAIQALRDDERVAASWGIDIVGHKLLAFVMSGAMAGIAGALFASIETRVDKGNFSLNLSITFLLMTVVGGAGNRWGVVQGGMLFAALPTLLDRAHANFHVFPFSQLESTWEPAIGALLLILTLTMFPGGIAQQQDALLSWLGGGKFKKDPEKYKAQGGGMGARP